MNRQTRVVIIGGGIGGLTAAHALLRRGFEVQVYESAPELKEIGAGVALGANAMKALRSLDLEQPVRDVGWEGEYSYLRNWKTGRVIAKTQRQNRFGATGCSVHRADLLDVLSSRLPDNGRCVQLAARCVGVETSAKGATAKFQGGNEVEADVVIGADGIHSAVRGSIIGPDKPRFTGKICYRCLVRTDDIPGGLYEGAGATWLGPHGTIVVYKVRRGELVNVVCHYDDDSWKEESWIREVDRDEVIDRYAGWHESLLRLFSVSKVHYKWALHDREPLDHWSVGRVTLLGDAAHPMLPYLGQGACQAIEDGVVLARALEAAPDDPDAALEQYERTRLPRANRVVLSARARGVDNHLVSPIAAFKRDALIAIRRRFGKDPSGRNSAWIPDYDAASVALVR